MSTSTQKSDVTFVTTTEWQQVTEFGTGYGFNHILVKNYTGGIVEVAFGETDNPDLVIPLDTDVVLDDLYGRSPIYARNITGVGGDLYIKVWADINIP